MARYLCSTRIAFKHRSYFSHISDLGKVNEELYLWTSTWCLVLTQYEYESLCEMQLNDEKINNQRTQSVRTLITISFICVYFSVIKARMESEIMKNGLPRLRVRILRMYKQGRVKINNRHQLLDKRGLEITCSCSNLKVNKVYLILGKEDKRRRLLYLDNFSTAVDWSKNGKQYIRANRKNNSCPQRRTP